MWTKIKTDNMETPLESNKFIGERKKAIDAGEDSFVVNGKTYKVTGSPAKFVGGVLAATAGLGQQPGTASYGGLLAQQQANQMAESDVNPVALGGLQNRIPSIVGQQIPGSFDKACPTPLNKKGCKYKK